MKRQLAAGAAILAVVAGVGTKLATQPETATSLEDVRLVQHSEHAHPGPTRALAGIRIRLSPNDFDDAVMASAHQVPNVAVTPR